MISWIGGCAAVAEANDDCLLDLRPPDLILAPFLPAFGETASAKAGTTLGGGGMARLDGEAWVSLPTCADGEDTGNAGEGTIP